MPRRLLSSLPSPWQAASIRGAQMVCVAYGVRCAMPLTAWRWREIKRHFVGAQVGPPGSHPSVAQVGSMSSFSAGFSAGPNWPRLTSRPRQGQSLLEQRDWQHRNSNYASSVAPRAMSKIRLGNLRLLQNYGCANFFTPDAALACGDCRLRLCSHEGLTSEYASIGERSTIHTRRAKKRLHTSAG